MGFKNIKSTIFLFHFLYYYLRSNSRIKSYFIFSFISYDCSYIFIYYLSIVKPINYELNSNCAQIICKIKIKSNWLSLPPPISPSYKNRNIKMRHNLRARLLPLLLHYKNIVKKIIYTLTANKFWPQVNHKIHTQKFTLNFTDNWFENC